MHVLNYCFHGGIFSPITSLKLVFKTVHQKAYSNDSNPFFKERFIFNYVCACVCVCAMCAGAERPEKGIESPGVEVTGS